MDAKPKTASWIEECKRNERFFFAETLPSEWKLDDCFKGFEFEVPHDTIPAGTEWVGCEQQGHYRLIAKEKDTHVASEHSDTVSK
jgi:hypothetical protein